MAMMATANYGRLGSFNKDEKKGNWSFVMNAKKNNTKKINKNGQFEILNSQF